MIHRRVTEVAEKSNIFHLAAETPANGNRHDLGRQVTIKPCPKGLGFFFFGRLSAKKEEKILCELRASNERGEWAVKLNHPNV